MRAVFLSLGHLQNYLVSFKTVVSTVWSPPSSTSLPGDVQRRAEVPKFYPIPTESETQGLASAVSVLTSPGGDPLELQCENRWLSSWVSSRTWRGSRMAPPPPAMQMVKYTVV